jgi:acetyl-CoA acetyltransferase
VVGVEKNIMGIGNDKEIEKIMKIDGKKMSEIELVEIKEEFGDNKMECKKEMKMEMEKLNVNGGEIEVGNKVGD